MNVTVHAAETSVDTLTGTYLPLLLRAAGDVSADFARHQSRARLARRAAGLVRLSAPTPRGRG